VQPGTSALMVIVRKITPDKFIEALHPYGGHGAARRRCPATPSRELIEEALRLGRRGPDPALNGPVNRCGPHIWRILMYADDACPC